MDFYEHTERYRERLGRALRHLDWTRVSMLVDDILRCRQYGLTVYLMGNGGSAANSEHICNDLQLCGVRSIALSANSATVTCIGNDAGFDTIFMLQLALLARNGDILIALSGSGNSPNILRALEHARRAEIPSYAIVGFNGGKARELATCPIHVPVDDMQIAEDCQSVITHTVMQWLRAA